MKKQIRVTLPSAPQEAPQSAGEVRRTYTSTEVVEIADLSVATSSIEITGRSGYAGSESWVAVAIEHGFIGDLSITLTGPSGTVYTVLTFAQLTNILDLSAEPASGTWTLTVSDLAGGDDGQLNSWSLSF